MANPILVEVDPDIIDLLPGFFDNRKKNIAEIKDGLSNNNFDSIHMAAHKMKGSCALYGFTELSEIARVVETAAKAENKEQIIAEIPKMEDYLKRVKVTNL
jgi:HPt (histidine-containing phosphotransfer) domain-containing protein